MSSSVPQAGIPTPSIEGLLGNALLADFIASGFSPSESQLLVNQVFTNSISNFGGISTTEPVSLPRDANSVKVFQEAFNKAIEVYEDVSGEEYSYIEDARPSGFEHENEDDLPMRHARNCVHYLLLGYHPAGLLSTFFSSTPHSYAVKKAKNAFWDYLEFNYST